MSATKDAKAKGIAMTFVGSEADEQRFCRRLSAEVNQGPLYLSRVMVTGRQVYPFHIPTLGQPDMLFRCEFRPRDVSKSISTEHIEDLLGRIGTYQILEAHVITGEGIIGDRLELPVTVGR